MAPVLSGPGPFHSEVSEKDGNEHMVKAEHIESTGSADSNSETKGIQSDDEGSEHEPPVCIKTPLSLALLNKTH